MLIRSEWTCSMAVPQARAGVGVLVVKHKEGQDLVLVGKRKGSHGAGTYAVPGGHLEFGESFEECAVREIQEETGITLSGPITFEYATNSVFDEQRHYVTVFMKAEVPEDTEALLMEPDKCEGWLWCPYHDIPRPLFLPLEHLLASPYRLQPVKGAAQQQTA